MPKSELQIFSLLVESKPRPPCLSTPSAVGKKATNHVLVKGSSTSHTPVQQTPSSRPVSHTEPRAAPHSRYDPTAASLKTGFGFWPCPVVHLVRVVVCKTPGCFLQSLSVPGSSYCLGFKQRKEELTNKLYQLYNTSVFDSKVRGKPAVVFIVIIRGVCSGYDCSYLFILMHGFY